MQKAGIRSDLLHSTRNPIASDCFFFLFSWALAAAQGPTILSFADQSQLLSGQSYTDHGALHRDLCLAALKSSSDETK